MGRNIKGFAQRNSEKELILGGIIKVFAQRNLEKELVFIEKWGRAPKPGTPKGQFQGPPCGPLKSLLEPFSVPLVGNNTSSTSINFLKQNLVYKFFIR